MLKIVMKKLRQFEDLGNEVPPNVSMKTSIDAAGNNVELIKVDASSEYLTDALNFVFRNNVERARRENEIIFGFADPVTSEK